VSPVTLRPRFNPNATDPASDVSNDHLPASVDHRQASWFTAAWTALSLGFLAAPGTIDSVTYFETVGPRGVMDARTAEPYPVLELLRALAGRTEVRLCASSDPEVCDALILHNGDLVQGDVEPSLRTRVIIVNVSGQEREVHLIGYMDERITAVPHGLTIVDLPGGRHDRDAH
jgi:hypothetical protein